MYEERLHNLHLELHQRSSEVDVHRNQLNALMNSLQQNQYNKEHLENTSRDTFSRYSNDIHENRKRIEAKERENNLLANKLEEIMILIQDQLTSKQELEEKITNLDVSIMEIRNKNKINVVEEIRKIELELVSCKEKLAEDNRMSNVLKNQEKLSLEK